MGREAEEEIMKVKNTGIKTPKQTTSRVRCAVLENFKALAPTMMTTMMNEILCEIEYLVVLGLMSNFIVKRREGKFNTF